MAKLTMTIGAQSAERTFADARALAVLTALGEAAGVPATASAAQRALAGFDAMIADAATRARDYRRAQGYATVNTDVDSQVGWDTPTP